MLKKNIKNLIGVTLIVTSLIGCTTTQVVSPVTDIVPLQSLAKEGDTLLVVDATKEAALVNILLGETIGERAKKISLDITPNSTDYPLVDFKLNAVIEGKFPSLITKIALSSIEGLEKSSTDGSTFYQNDDIQVGLLKKNMIGFSNYSFHELSTSIKQKNEGIEKSTVIDLYSANIGLYAINPSTIFDLGLGLTKTMITHMDSILLLINEDDEGGKILDATFDLDTNSSASSLSKLVRIGYMSNLKKLGEKPDYKILKIMFTTEGEIVNISEMPLSDEQFNSLTNTITDSNIGL